MTTIPQLEIVGQVGGRSAALKLVTEQPDLVLIDSSWPDNEVKAMLRQVKTEQPQTYCIVLTGSE